MSQDKKQPLVILAGPTAAGKTKLSIELAKRIGGEIISADSMQVYRHMDIGSAKVTEEEKQGIPHYGIDLLDPHEEYNVQAFQAMAKAAAREIWQKGKIPIVAGGTGFYIQALLYDIDFTEQSQRGGYRERLQMQASTEEGRRSLYQKLLEIDPDSAAAIHENNTKRMIRALEFFHETGTPISAHNKEQRQKISPYRFCYFVITDDRSRLYERIDRRVDGMLESGLVEEVRHLQQMGLDRSFVSMQGIGYKEILDYLGGSTSLEEAAYIIKRDTRHFAKRQLTWFRREPDACWIDRSALGTEETMLQEMMSQLKEKDVIS